MDERFGKKEKLKSKILINRLFSEGKSLTKFPLKLIYLPISTPRVDLTKTGVSVPKRNFRKATERIHLKRLMREAFRKNKYLVYENTGSPYALMFIYIGKNEVKYQKLESVTAELLRRFVQQELDK